MEEAFQWLNDIRGEAGDVLLDAGLCELLGSECDALTRTDLADTSAAGLTDHALVFSTAPFDFVRAGIVDPITSQLFLARLAGDADAEGGEAKESKGEESPKGVDGATLRAVLQVASSNDAVASLLRTRASHAGIAFGVSTAGVLHVIVSLVWRPVELGLPSGVLHAQPSQPVSDVAVQAAEGWTVKACEAWAVDVSQLYKYNTVGPVTLSDAGATAGIADVCVCGRVPVAEDSTASWTMLRSMGSEALQEDSEGGLVLAVPSGELLESAGQNSVLLRLLVASESSPESAAGGHLVVTSAPAEAAVDEAAAEAAEDSMVVAQPFTHVAVEIGEAGGLDAVRLRLSSTSGVPAVTHALLVQGSSAEESHEQCPPGYEMLDTNLAETLGELLGAVRKPSRPAMDAAEEAKEEGEASPDTARLDVEPAHLHLCVMRDAGMVPCVHMVLKAALWPSEGEAPAYSLADGYTLQATDVAVRCEGVEAPQTARVMLAQTAETAVVQPQPLLADGPPQDASMMSSGAEAEEEFDEVAAAAALRDREELLELLQASAQEHARLTEDNASLQRTLSAYFAVRMSEDERNAAAAAAAAGAGARASAAAAAAFAAADKERKYRDALEGVTAHVAKAAAAEDRANAAAFSLQARLDEKEARLLQIIKSFAEFKREIGTGAVHSLTGKAIPPHLLTKYEEQETAKDAEVSRVQLKHIHLQSQLRKIEAEASKRDQLSDGLAMIDFEQLKIENSTLNEKIEDRNEELGKLRKKTTTAVQVLTHVREKLHFVSAEALRLQADLDSIESEVSEYRARLAAGKKSRERLRLENERARNAQGFAFQDKLAIDFDVRKRKILSLKEKLAQLQARFTALQ